MITLLEALNFRCLRYIRQPLGSFHVLVGPNASGKTTFLDVIAFLSDLESDRVEAALDWRTQDFRDLVWGRMEGRFELAVEAQIPDDRRSLLAVKEYDTIRYEIAIGIDPNTTEVTIKEERGWLRKSITEECPQKTLFPLPNTPPESILAPPSKPRRSLFAKTPGGNDNYYADAHERDGRWAPSFKLGPRKSTLANLPEDEENFPVSTWFKQLLSNGVERMVLNGWRIRLASPPGQGRGFQPDGSNLPWVLADLEKNNPELIREWVKHLQTALPDLADVQTIERPDDRHRYLVLVYKDGLKVPSWMASDGTLRLLALTLPAYLPGFRGIYLIEEPENGIHPRAVAAMCQSLSSIYDAQVLMATHSPVILSQIRPENVLCFAKTPQGATDIVLGSQHPKLRDWRGEENLGVLFAGGVLG